jgi:N-acetylglucosaminyldiphosphoundecaprenol N-acetyl-beta-D-mannosaminyltransferase
MIKKAEPDILFVGLGAPKQEKWIYNSYKELNVPVSIGIGVSFELISGMIMRAPVWIQKSGLEWLWRLISEPRRLWKRYLIDDMQFLRMILKQKFEFRPKNLDLAKGI